MTKQELLSFSKTGLVNNKNICILENGDIVDIDGDIRYQNKNKIKLLYKKPKNRIEYGLIGINTRIGQLEYSYQTGVDYDANYQLETILSNYHELTSEELDEIDEIISNEIK